MALSLILSEAKLTATQMNTQAKVTLEQVEGGFAITAVHLTLKAKIPGTDQATFTELANKAKAGCPVSKVLKANITLDATLEFLSPALRKPVPGTSAIGRSSLMLGPSNQRGNGR